MSRFLLRGCVISNLSAALFRTSVLREVGPLTRDFRACSDWELFFRMARRHDVAYIAEPLNYFRQHEATIRSRMKERETYQEYFRLLFGAARSLDLTFAERSGFRTHAMFLWAANIVRPSFAGVADFPHHLRTILRLDPAALLFLPAGILLRIGDLAGKMLRIGRRGDAAA
jgi:hypothetical protein